jgi:hypothetical protein
MCETRLKSQNETLCIYGLSSHAVILSELPVGAFWRDLQQHEDDEVSFSNLAPLAVPVLGASTLR